MKISHPRQEWSERIYAYESRLDKTQRTRTGTFYTPWEIVQPMVEKALQPLTLRADGSFRSLEELRRVRIADPACGTGVFLLEACFQWGEILRRQAQREGKDLPQPCGEVVRRNLWGIDIDSQAVEIARELLTLAGEGEVPPNLFVADSLKNWQNRAIFPDGGFDALIGNPPFLGGRKIRRMLGDDYFQFLTEEFAPGVSGNADLCAYFFRLAEKVARPGGICGFLATNTIAEGDTRRGGLDVLVQKGARIFHAERFSWQRDAVVQVRGIHLQFPGDPDAFEPPCQLYG
ncbi:MAG: N-6 DNA methylase, partial [Planctomycetia bacterium]|nr:N-6 DNA methylase [Planctomycetia bacterium]